MVSDWAYLRDSNRLGFFSLGRDFPVTAAYTQAAVKREKLPLILDVIQAISDRLTDESTR